MVKFFKLYKRYGLKKILYEFDRRLGLGRIESLIASNWINPFLTLYLNFRCLALKDAVKIPIFVYGRPRMDILVGKIIIKGKTSMGMIKFNNSSYGAPAIMTIQSQISILGTLIFNGSGRIGTGTKIFIGEYGVLEIGSNFKIMDCCTIGCYRSIFIGHDTWIVHKSQLLDSDYHYTYNLNDNSIKNYRRKIHIGNHCWVCSSTTVSGDAFIPDYTVVASNSLVNRNFADLRPYSLIGGIPAKFIKNGIIRIDNGDLEIQLSLLHRKNSDEIIIHKINDISELLN